MMAFKLSILNWTKYLKKAAILAFMGMVVIFAYIFYLAQDLPSLDQLENYDPDLVTRIYSADGEILNELYLEKRIFISIDLITNNMKNALIASEDRRFYNHWGISMRDVFRAVVINLISLIMNRVSVLLPSKWLAPYMIRLDLRKRLFEK